ncbi:hypothetical protein B0H17DRAFT_1264898 [Mycena rosella]|uniref:Uncharacterized protein n=1 Tax=Mycena rosella TaxID=1033263 RepID=A0AAD7MBB0_MYCRO|nr:hypothetical protein B0H17DRAFT_1264898 [Mycena rosella]
MKRETVKPHNHCPASLCIRQLGRLRTHSRLGSQARCGYLSARSVSPLFDGTCMKRGRSPPFWHNESGNAGYSTQRPKIVAIRAQRVRRRWVFYPAPGQRHCHSTAPERAERVTSSPFGLDECGVAGYSTQRPVSVTVIRRRLYVLNVEHRRDSGSTSAPSLGIRPSARSALPSFDGVSLPSNQWRPQWRKCGVILTRTTTAWCHWVFHPVPSVSDTKTQTRGKLWGHSDPHHPIAQRYWVFHPVPSRLRPRPIWSKLDVWAMYGAIGSALKHPASARRTVGNTQRYRYPGLWYHECITSVEHPALTNDFQRTIHVGELTFKTSYIKHPLVESLPKPLQRPLDCYVVLGANLLLIRRHRERR